MVDAPRPELDGELDGTCFGELVAVKTQLEACGLAGHEIAASLRGVEGATFEEHVSRFRARRGVRKHLGERKVQIVVAARELGWNGMGTEPRRNPPGEADRLERRELGVAVEPVA